MDVDFPSCPEVANADHSSAHEALFPSNTFDKAYVIEAYATLPDHSLASFSNYDSSFGQPLSSVEAPAPGAFAPKNPVVFNPPLPAATVAPAT